MTNEAEGRVQGRVAMITGGGAGLGRATALMLAREGADIVICDINEAAGTQLQAEIESFGGRAIAFATDTTDEDQVASAVSGGVGRFGKIDILVNNAGIVTTDPILELTADAWDRVVAVHLRSTFLCSRAVGLDMRNRSWGRVVNIISRAAFRGRIGNGPYAAAKGAILAFSRVMANEFAPYGVTVNNIAPGSAVTPMLESVYPTAEQQAAEAERSGVVTVPTRLLQPEEIAEAVLYFCGPHSDQTTGATLHVNGGSFMP